MGNDAARNDAAPNGCDGAVVFARLIMPTYRSRRFWWGGQLATCPRTAQPVNLFSTFPRRGALLMAIVALLGFGGACDGTGSGKAADGSPEATADAFVDAYFRRADQVAARPYAALGASNMLEREIADVAKIRGDGYTPTEAALDVSAVRGARTMRGKRVRFDYTLTFKDLSGEVVKHADVELALLQKTWKVVRVGLANAAAPFASSSAGPK